MGVGRVVYERVLARIETSRGDADIRSARSFAWLVTGMMLEQDVRLSRIALAMDRPESMDARVRRLRRFLDGPCCGQQIYHRLITRTAKG